jgi:multidrug efflux pump subunit AcrB
MMERTDRRGALAWMAGHPVAANLVMMACILGGLLMLQNMRQEVFPTFDIDSVSVSVSYPGASPEEIEEGIILAVEEAVSGLDGIDEITSKAQEGVGTVTIEALDGTDMQRLTNEVKNEVDGIITFPVDAEEPTVTQSSRRKRGLSIVLFGDTSERTLHEITEQVRDELLQDPAINQVELFGIRPMEISVEVSQENLRRYGLSLQQIANIIQSSSLDLPGGTIKTDAGEILVRMKERRDYGQEFADIPVISAADGTQVRLGEIATIKDSYEELDSEYTFDGKLAMMIDVYTTGDETPISVSETVRSKLGEIRPTLPEGIGIEIRSDRSEIYAQRMDLLLRNSALGIILVLAALSLFLEIRLAFWVMMGIPISFMGAFLVLPMMDVSLNMVSLFAFIIALGIVVDDAIVVGEHIYHFRQEGEKPLAAAIRGVREMATPVTFSILTNIATFMPIYFVPGMMGKIFAVIPVVVVTVFLVSLLESLFVLPAHLAALQHKKRSGLWLYIHERQQAFSHWFRHWVRDIYGPFLDRVLEYRGTTIVIAFVLLFTVLSFAFSGRMGMTMFPKVESDYAKATVTLPYGTAFEHSEVIGKRLVETARQVAASTGKSDELLEGIFARVGQGSSNIVVVTVYLADPEIRDKILTTAAFTEAWRKAFGEVAGVESMLFQSDAGGPGSGATISIELNHRDMAVLEEASAEMAAALAEYPKVKDINDGFSGGKPQYDFEITDVGRSLGFDAAEVARQVRNAFYGAEVVRQLRGRNELKVMVRLPEAERRSEYNLATLILRSPDGTEVPFYDAVRVKQGTAYTEINRRDGRRVILVEADISPRRDADEVLNDLQVETIPNLLEKHPGLRISFQGRQADMRESMGSLKTSFIFAMLAVYAMLAIPFKSYSQPLIVMVAIPFGIIGAILGHLLMGYGLSIVSLMGVVALSGIVVNDSLVLINHANELRHRSPGQSVHAIIHQAAIQRFRPILLTTLTTFGGLMPMLFETSRQAKFLIPMAISLGFGILFATLITLILVPALYMTIETWRGGRRGVPH